MNTQELEQIEKQIDMQLDIHDKEQKLGNNKKVVDALSIIEKLLNDLNRDEINLRTDKIIQ
jgi:hypothetical protein